MTRLAARAAPWALGFLAALAPAAPVRAAEPPLRRADDLLPASAWIEDRNVLLLRHQAVLGVAGEATSALRFGATRFTAEGPWSEWSLRRDDGRVLRLWLTDSGEPEPLFGDERAARTFSLRWSLSPRRER